MGLDTTGSLLGQCQVTGKKVPQEDLVLLDGQWVCAEGKQILLDRLKAGGSNELLRPSFGERFGASFIDGILLGGGGLLLGMLAGGLILVLTLSSENGARFMGGIQALVMVMGAAYLALMHGRGGQTIGKKMAKTKVVRMDGQPMDLKTAAIRAVAYYGPGMLTPVVVMASPTLGGNPIFTGVGVVWSLANVVVALLDRSQNRAIHDRIAGTRVVKI